MKLKKIASKAVGMVVNAVTSGVSQTSPGRDKTVYEPVEGMSALCRAAAADSFVLLKNDPVGGERVLPLTDAHETAFFGRVQFDTFFVGYGSGGDVNPHYTVCLHEGIAKNKSIRRNRMLEDVYRAWIKKNKADDGYWGHWPMCYEEMPVSPALVRSVRQTSDTAVVFLGRAAGEDRENTLTKGSYYLTDEETKLLRAVRAAFERVAVVLNIGSIMDLGWIDEFDIPCVGICWQGGMETGNAVADVLSGKVNPSGRLPDTVAMRYEDLPSAGHFGGKKQNVYEEDIFVGYRYFSTFAPEKARFFFGHGLSYTTFSIKTRAAEQTARGVTVEAAVTNTGAVPGKLAFPLYVRSEIQPALALPRLRLIAFDKTPSLAPGETYTLRFFVGMNDLSAYDDTGESGYKNAWVVPAGAYTICHGALPDGGITQIALFPVRETVLIEQTESHGAPDAAFLRLQPLKWGRTDGTWGRSYAPVPLRNKDLRAEILAGLPKELQPSEDRSLTLYDAALGRCTLEDFAATLTDEELEAISRGDYVMNSPLGPTGNAGVFGGTLESLRERGVIPITTTDGPSGIRLAAKSALLPSGTALAATFDPALVRGLYEKLGQEMRARGSDVLLAPGMNIHRDPLCGRNFEYFSEDPLLTGKMAAAVILGLRDAGADGCVKHFACNNQETRRTKHNSILSERALREIYLRGFEICIKEAKPRVLMTSYNKINGAWGHYNYELVTGILRGEWGYDGLVITDWWMQPSASPEFPSLRNQAYRVRAGVDVLMPGGGRTGKRAPDGTLTETLGQPEGITRGEMQQTALHVLRFILGSGAFAARPEADKKETNAKGEAAKEALPQKNEA